MQFVSHALVISSHKNALSAAKPYSTVNRIMLISANKFNQLKLSHGIIGAAINTVAFFNRLPFPSPNLCVDYLV